MAAIQNTGGFDDRFLAKLSKVDREGLESFLTNLVREKQFLQVVFNAMLDGLVVLRPNLEVLYINTSALEMLGINRRSRIYREHFAALTDIPELKDLLSRFALKHEQIMHAEIEVPGHEQRWLDISLLPIEQKDSPQAGTSVMIIHDNTELRKAQMERGKAERADTLARLTASLAHEIKNPLNSLQIHAQLLGKALREDKPRKTDQERIQQSSNVILEEISRLNKVVNDFLTAVRPTRPMKDRADINRLIEHVYATLRPEMEARGIVCTLRLDREIPSVQIDPSQVTQAVLNLVKNSMEALQEQKEVLQAQPQKDLPPEMATWSPAMEIQTRIIDEHYQVRVADNGPGISDENLQKVLEPYYTTKFSGTGLGLAIVSRIVEEHGGYMEISSKEGKGTVVSISLPLEGKPVRLLEARTGMGHDGEGAAAGGAAAESAANNGTLIGYSDIADGDEFPYESAGNGDVGPKNTR